MKTGEKARLKIFVPQGEIIKTEYDEETQDLKHLLEYTGEDGETHTGWFPASKLEKAK